MRREHVAIVNPPMACRDPLLELATSMLSKGVEPIPDPGAWDRSLELHEHYLRLFARQFLGGSDLYNAAKHGLALTTGEAGIELRGLVGRRGPSIRYLAVKNSESDPRDRWREMVHWVKADQQMLFIRMGGVMLRNLWSVARHRYASKPGDGLRITLLTGDTPFERIIKDHEDEGPMILSDAGFQLAYFRDDDDATDPETPTDG
jgi:hypothetical protein